MAKRWLPLGAFGAGLTYGRGLAKETTRNLVSGIPRFKDEE